MGRHEDARRHYEVALVAEPTLAEAAYNLGSLYDDLGNVAQATLWYRRALEIRPDYADAHFNLASALERGVDELEVVSDSELLVRQMRGEYKVKSPTLRELVDEAQGLAGRLGSVRYTAVRREHNELADRLVNEALDSAG